VQSRTRIIALGDDAETVVLDFVDPTGTGRRLFGRSRQARLKSGKGLLGAQAALELIRSGHRPQR